MGTLQLKSISRLTEADFLTDFRVNALGAALVNTPLAAKLLANPQTAEQIAQLHPLQRIGQPDEIAKLAAFLLSPDAAWITGQIIGIDGGRSSLRPKG